MGSFDYNPYTDMPNKLVGHGFTGGGGGGGGGGGIGAGSPFGTPRGGTAGAFPGVGPPPSLYASMLRRRIPMAAGSNPAQNPRTASMSFGSPFGGGGGWGGAGGYQPPAPMPPPVNPYTMAPPPPPAQNLDPYGGYGPPGQDPNLQPDLRYINPIGPHGWSDTQMTEQMLERMINAGMFDPNGNPQMLGALRARAFADTGAQERSAQLGADVSGLDPTQRATMMLGGSMSRAGALSNELNNAGMQSALQNQQRLDQFTMPMQYYNYSPYMRR